MHAFLQRALRATLAVGVLITATTAHATDYDLLSDQEIDQRLSFLNSKLDAIESPSTYWQYGWTGFYAVSAIAQAAKAADESDSDDSTKQWVGAVKSAGGLALMLFKPLPVVTGMDDYRQMPATSRAQKIARLKEAEQLMRHSAWRANERHTWKPHLMTVGVNLLGAAAIAAFGDSDDALGSAALGIAIGEAAIWSQPSAPQQYWQDYQNKFSGQQTAYQWRITPTYNGINLEVRF
ncbi:hypothetical protein IC617_16560 [Neiella sp. HB171785]|uniref:Uncharacterized protein n=1 Tax=Neiella litorisoli TaxID=2771431 RepID=A0A8J6QS48_9GAMM|nr:hypothetical protein [Neiella litorisoli]MBD1391041.1 hypothetical protein [Neiella litorisoli]